MSIKPLTLRSSPFAVRIEQVQPGETAYLDAPYGTFSVDANPEAPGYPDLDAIVIYLANLR